MKRKTLIVIGLLLASLFGFAGHAAAGCPGDSIMVAGGAPGYPSVCMELGPTFLKFLNR